MSVELSSVLNSLLSRQLTLAALETQQAMQSNLETRWRLIVSVGNTADVNLRITVSNMSSAYTIRSSISRGSAVDFTGFGAIIVEATNQGGAAVGIEVSLDTQTTERPSAQFCSQTQVINNAGFSAVASDTVNGFAPPFCRYLRLFADGNIDIQCVDQAGNVVAFYPNIPPESVLLNDFHVPCFARVEAQSVAPNANIMALWY